MKKTLKKAIAVATLALASSTALAQEGPMQLPGGVTALPIVMPCNRSDQIFDLLTTPKYDEQVIALGNANVFTPQQRPVKGQLTVWYNPKEDSKNNFSIVFTVAGTDISCIITSGIEMQVVPLVSGDKL